MTQTTPPPALAHGEPPPRGREVRPLRERVEELTKRLRSEHDEFERAAQSWTPEADEKKREARKARETTLKEIQDLLASEGEAERAARIDRLPFARKLIELEAWVGGTARPSQPAPAPRASAAPPPAAPSIPDPPPPVPSPPPPPQTSSPPAPLAAPLPAPIPPGAQATGSAPVSDRPEPVSASPAEPAAQVPAVAPGPKQRPPILLGVLEAVDRHRTIAIRVGAGLLVAAVVAGVWSLASHPAAAADATPPQPASVVPLPGEPPAGQADIAASGTPESPAPQPETSALGSTPKHPVAPPPTPVLHARPRPKPSQQPPARAPHPHETSSNPY